MDLAAPTTDGDEHCQHEQVLLTFRYRSLSIHHQMDLERDVSILP